MTLTEDERADIAERYGWQPGERERFLADTAERAARNKRDEMLRWCQQHTETTHAAEQAERDKPKRDRSNMPTQDQLWDAWVDTKIRTALQASQKALLAGVGDVMAEERQKLRQENEALRARLDELTERVNQLDPVQRSSTPPHLLRAVNGG